MVSKKKTPEWREFEKLVARIEEAAAPAEASVESPDRIPDLVTGTLREVDASIRYDIGTVPVLITIECRRHKDPQDVMWVEQLIAKREAIGAARTIAVSWAGFSKEAKAVARRGGVELRRLEDVDRADIQSWLVLMSVLHVFRQSRVIGVRIAYRQRAGDSEDITPSAEVESARKQHGVNAKIFTRTDENTLMSVSDIWLLVQAQNDFYVGVPPPRSRISRTITLNMPKGALTMPTTDGSREVAQIVLEMELWREVEEVPLEEGLFHRYSDSAGMEIQRSEFTTTLRNLDVALALQGEKESREVRFEISVKMNAPHH